MRAPKLGEMLHCGACHGHVDKVDEDWLEWFNKQNSQARRNVYFEPDDYFLSYCGCEDQLSYEYR